MELSDRVKFKRLELNMSQDELARRMGYKSRSSINKIEMGRPVTQKIIVKLAAALNVTPAYLMGWEPDLPTQQPGSPPPEDPVTAEIINAVRSMPADQQQQVLDYVQYLASREHK